MILHPVGDFSPRRGRSGTRLIRDRERDEAAGGRRGGVVGLIWGAVVRK